MNIMKRIKIEKIVLSVGGTGEELEKGFKLLRLLTERTPTKIKTRKRIPSLDVRPNLEVGAIVTIRKGAEEILKKMLTAKDNILNKKSVSENTFSFGLKEYLEIPGVEYQRSIGIRGLDVTVDFTRYGRRVKIKKIKKGRFPKKQQISKEEVINFMEDKFKTKFI